MPVVRSQGICGRMPVASDVVVLALPRGGVVVGFELARELALPLDIYLVRKLGVPGREELAMGAIAGDGTRVLNTSVIAHLGITDDEIASIALHEGRELERREQRVQGRARGHGDPRADGDPRG